MVIGIIQESKLSLPHGASFPVAIDNRGAAGLERVMPSMTICVDCGSPCYIPAKRCRPCYHKRQLPSTSERFWRHVDRRGPDECWPWLAARNELGYGVFWVCAPRRFSVLAHHMAWELTNGPIPPGKLICHRCDNPPCCNPRHGFVGVHTDNMADMKRKGRGGNRYTRRDVS
jgi:hypothetical protein